MKRKDSQLDVFETDDFVYRSDRQFFHFVINSSNSLGYRIENKIINQYNIVKPDLPVVHIKKITTNSVTLSWSIPNYQTYIKYTDGLVYEFFLKTKNFEWFKIMPDIKSYNEYFWVEINNLFSYMEYSVHLRVKANKTIDDDRMWSRKFIENFTTLSGPPNKSPEIDIGSFSFYPEGKFLSLFWRKLPEYEQNGPNFTYKITSIKEDGQVINPTIIMNKHLSSALIFIEWKNTSKYQFELKSQNQMGFSANSSVLKISPRHLNISHEEQKQAITKIYHKTNQTYTITWLRPINFDALNSFTLFWCEARTGSKNQCQGRVDFKTLDKSSLNYMTGQFNTSLNFALSENYYNNSYSSGMLWAMCAPDDETKIFSISIDKVTKRTESTITIHWIKKCWHMTYIDGYILTYCEANSKKCEEKIVPKDANNYEIVGLKSSTLYKITLRTFLETTLGQISDFVMEATTEENDKTKSIITICLSIMTIAVTLGLLFSLRNKCRKMQKIGVILPEAPKEDAIIPTENDSNGFLLDQKQLIKSKNYLTTTNSAHSNDINDQNCSCYQPIPTRENKKSISTSIEENDMISDSNQKAENSYSKISTFQNLSGGYVSPSLIFTQLQQRTATSNKNSSPPLNDGDELPMDLTSIYNPANDQTTKIKEKPKYFNGYI
ncbi:cytokine receptor-like isoform X2 [Episyrphus balteatus]|nr:cytokine receptor-like isoform X2 [Episyrphus balteatus]